MGRHRLKFIVNLSIQVLSAIGNVMGVIVQCSIGGLSVGRDIAAYRKGVHAVVGTPGRVIDLIRYRLTLYSSPLLHSPSYLYTLVLHLLSSYDLSGEETCQPRD